MAKTKKATKNQQEEENPQVENEKLEAENEEVVNEEEAGEAENATNNPSEEPAAELSEEQKDFRDMYIRLMAEFDNYRKRTQREKADLIRFGNKDLMAALLPVLDDLDRTVDAIEKTDNLASVKEGVNMVSKKIHQIFSRQGLEPIDAKGKEFDSGLHEAVQSLEMGEEHVGKVIDEVEKGYRYKEQVVRYSKVIVGE